MGKPTDKEIEKQLDAAIEIIHSGESTASSMTYEEGVRAALEWVLYGDDKPIEL